MKVCEISTNIFYSTKLVLWEIEMNSYWKGIEKKHCYVENSNLAKTTVKYNKRVQEPKPVYLISQIQCLPLENPWWVKKSSPKITEVSDISLSISVHYLAKAMLFSRHLYWAIFFLNPTKIKIFLKFWLRVNNIVLEQPVTKAVRYLKQIWQTQSCLLFDVLDEAALYGKFFNSQKMNRKWNMCFLFFDEVSDFSWAGDLLIAPLRWILRERWWARAIACLKRQALQIT